MGLTADRTLQKIDELENKAIESIQNKTNMKGKKEKEKNPTGPMYQRRTSSRWIYVIGDSKREQMGEGTESIFEKNSSWAFSKFDKKYLQELQISRT